ncbi:MAG: HEPN domain-containing protein [Nitrososphaera sp.]|nr:HEPN domain-containing protein [Nitrososphaera sp.]
MELLLKELLDVLAKLPQEIRSRLVSGQNVDRARAQLALRKSRLAVPLIPLIEKLNIATQGGSMRWFVNTATFLDANTIATWLIERAAFIGASDAVSELTAYSTAETFLAREILVLDGVTVDEPIELTSGTHLQPLASLQQTEFRDQFNEGAPWQPPRNRAALVRTFDHPVVLQHADTAAPKSLLDLAKDPGLHDVARIFTLMKGVAPVIVAQWWEHEPSLPSRTPTTGAHFTAGFESTFHASLIDSEAAEHLKEWIRLARDAPSSLWSVLRVVLDRLNAAKRRRAVVDRSIELGIAAEALFLRYAGEDQSELSFRLATRAAWLLGPSRAERARVYDLFRAIYEARSEAVHNGEVPNVVKKFDVIEMLSRGCEAMELAIIITLRRPGEDLRHVHLGQDSA